MSSCNSVYMKTIFKRFIDTVTNDMSEEEIIERGIAYLKPLYFEDILVENNVKEYYLYICNIKWTDIEKYVDLWNESIWVEIIDRMMTGILIEADVELQEIKNTNHLDRK